jgi:hypothetical protein
MERGYSTSGVCVVPPQAVVAVVVLVMFLVVVVPAHGGVDGRDCGGVSGVAVGGGFGGGLQDGYIEAREFTPQHLFVHVGDAPSARPRSAAAYRMQRGACDVGCAVRRQ